MYVYTCMLQVKQFHEFCYSHQLKTLLHNTSTLLELLSTLISLQLENISLGMGRMWRCVLATKGLSPHVG